MARTYDGPRLAGGKVHFPGKPGHLNQATSASPPKLDHGMVADPKGNFAGSMKPAAKLPAKAAQPTGPMLPQNLGRGPAPAPKLRAPEPQHSVMKAPPKSSQSQAKKTSLGQTLAGEGNSPRAKAERALMRRDAQRAKVTQARGLAQQRAQEKHQAAPRAPAPGGPEAPPPSASGQGLGDARRGFGRDVPPPAQVQSAPASKPIACGSLAETLF